MNMKIVFVTSFVFIFLLGFLGGIYFSQANPNTSHKPDTDMFIPALSLKDPLVQKITTMYSLEAAMQRPANLFAGPR